MNYNGWKNRETWLINVWFNPESPDDIDFIKDTVESDFDALPDYMRDFIDLNAIDWNELRDAVTQEDEDEQEGAA